MNPFIRNLVLAAGLTGTIGNAQEAKPAPAPNAPTASASTKLSKSEKKAKLTEAMFKAFESEDLDEAKKLINAGADLNTHSEKEGVLAVHYAIYKGDAALLKLIEKKGYKFKKTGQDADLSMLLAAAGGHVDMLEYLNKKGLPLNATDPKGQPLLFYAVEDGHIPAAEWLLNHGASINLVADGKSALLHSVQNGEEDAAMFLLSRGANPDVPNGSMLFGDALRHKMPKLALTLVNKVSNTVFYDQDDKSAYHYAVEQNLPELIEKLKGIQNPDQRDKYNRTPMYYAIDAKDLTLVKALRNNGAVLTDLDGRGESALSMPFRYELAPDKLESTLKFYDEMIKLGASVDGKRHGSSVLREAMMNRSGIPFAKKLVEAGAPLIDLDRDKSNLLHVMAGRTLFTDDADKAEFQDFMRSIVRKHPDLLNLSDSNTATPLSIALTQGSLEHMKILLEGGANPNSRLGTGYTVLHMAVSKNDPAAVELLLGHGADVNAQNDNGISPLHLAVKNAKMAEVLVKAGANKFIVDVNGITPYVRLAGKEVLNSEENHELQRPNGLPQKGIDPFNDRIFLGDQIEAIMRIGRDGRPALFNRWPDGTAVEDMKEMNINIVTSPRNVSAKVAGGMPFMTCSVSIQQETKSATTKTVNCLNGQSVDQAFVKLDDQYVDMVKEMAAYVESRYGIKMNVSVDNPSADMPNIEVFGYKGGAPEIGAFAELPPVQAASRYTNGYLLVNTEASNYTVTTVDKDDPNKKNAVPSDEDRRATFIHEFGHTAFGLQHLHDDDIEPRLNIRGHQNHTAYRESPVSSMSYAHNHFAPKDTTDVGDVEKTGPLDLILRRFMPNTAPALAYNEKYNLGGAYDMLQPLNRGKNSMPAFTVMHEGSAPGLRGIKQPSDAKLQWDMQIDANIGYCANSELTLRDANGIPRVDEKTGKPLLDTKLPVCFVEGTVNEIITYGGNDRITPTEGTNQFLDMGKGHNEVRLLYRNMGNKVIQTSGGDDELYIDQSVLKDRKIVPGVKKGMFVLNLVNADGTHGGSITLPNQLKGKDKGISHLNVINEDGSYTSYDVSGYRSVQDWRYKVALPLNTHFMNDGKGELKGAEVAGPAGPAVNRIQQKTPGTGPQR